MRASVPRVGGVIDDERLQELLVKASSLYNNGEYKGAIDAWREALTVDPGSQKAKEGIRMATLLLGDWEPAVPGAAPGTAEPTEPADGGGAGEPGLSPEEVEAKLDLGIARVKQLLAQRKYSEAIEGARGLLPINPDSEEIQRLLEEAQHAFESAPFIEEHLTLARELMAQERYPEAETECKKVFGLDATHPEARTLLAQIREKIQGHLKRAADQLGGMTVKLSLPDVLAAAKSGPAAAEKPQAAAPPKPQAASPKPEVAPTQRAKGTESARGFGGEIEPDAGDEPSIPLGAGGPPAHGAGASRQEDVSSRNALEAAFEQAGIVDEPIGGPAPAATEEPTERAGGKAEPGAGAAGNAFEGFKDFAEEASPPQTEPEVVEAKTVVPPSVRLVPRTPPSAPAQAAASKPAVVTPKPATGTVKPATAAPKPPPLPTAPGASTKSPPPVPPTSSAHSPSATQPGSPGQPHGAPAGAIAVSDPSPVDETAWETELTQLNIKQGQRDLLRGTPAKVGTARPDDQADADLMSFLDSDLTPLSEAPAAGAKAKQVKGATPGAGAKPPDLPPGVEGKSAKPAPEPDAPARPAREATGAGTKEKETPVPAVREQAGERPKTAPRSAPKGRSAIPRYFALLGLLLVAGGAAAWWFLFQPRSAGGAGTPRRPTVPPAGSSSGPVAGQTQGAIPTPIGSTSRQAVQDPQAHASSGDAPGLTAGQPDARSGTMGSAAAAVAGTAGATGASDGATATTLQAPQPIKPPTPALSPAEIRQKVAVFTADGRRLSAEGKWREARAKLSAALALDPANFDLKDLLDKVQAKLDEEQRLEDDFDAAKKAFNDKDYENALRKFYRLPRDKGLGDIDRYIRNAWFNWAVSGMKAGNATDALLKLKELLEVDPDDAEALKLQEVAEHYVSRAKDKVFYAFVDNLKLREFDQK